VRRFADRVVFYAVVLGVWEAAVDLGWIRPFSSAVPRASAAISTGSLRRRDFSAPCDHRVRSVRGLVLGVLFGIGSGFIAALWTRLADALDPVIALLNSMPRVAIAPMFIVWFGFGPGRRSRSAVSCTSLSFSARSGHAFGRPRVAAERSRDGRLAVRGAAHRQYAVHDGVGVHGAQTCISLALIGAVVGEFVGSQAGLGFLMLQASGSLDTTRLFSVMIVLGLLVYCSYGFAARGEHVLRWRPRTTLTT